MERYYLDIVGLTSMQRTSPGNKLLEFAILIAPPLWSQDVGVHPSDSSCKGRDLRVVCAYALNDSSECLAFLEASAGVLEGSLFRDSIVPWREFNPHVGNGSET